MSKTILIPHPDNKNIYYNLSQVVKIVKESTLIYWFHFSNGESVRIFDIDVIDRVRQNTDIRF
jgi:hypothetical protein